MALHTLTNDQWLLWTTHPYKVLGNLVIWVPALVVKRRVNQASIGYPLSSLAFDNPDSEPGDPANMEAGMLVKFYDGSTGAYKGFTRLLRGASGSTMTIHPVGKGDLEVADNDIFEVYDDYPPYAHIPYISPDGTLYKNYDTTFDGQTEDFPPIANVVVNKYADHIAPITNKITVTFDATSSLAMADGATIASYLWDVKDGTITVGSTSTSTMTATFPAGKRWVKLTVTDSNGTTAIKRVPIWAANDTTYKTFAAKVSRRGYSAGVGWEASFELLDDDTSTIPDHALVIFYKDEWFNDTQSNLRGTNTAFFGWITNETMHLEPLWSDNAINAQGPLAILQQRPAFPQTVRRADTPANWAEVKGLDWWKTVIYLLMFHSNILELVNIERPGFYADYPVPRLDSDAGSLYNQVVFLTKAVFAEFTCDAVGTLYLRRNPHYMTDAERSAHAPITLITSDDLVGDGQGPQFERRHWDLLAWMNSSALIANASTSVPLLSISPGTTPGQGVQIDSLDRILVLDQTDFNTRAGNVYAYRQSKRLGKRVMRQGTLTLAHSGDAIDPGWQEVFTLTLAADTNRRGFSFSTSRIVPIGCDIIDDHVNQASLTRLTVEEECQGYGAATVPVPDDTADDYPPDVADPPDTNQPPYVDYGGGAGPGLLGLSLARSSVEKSRSGYIVYAESMAADDWTALVDGLPYVDVSGTPRYAELVEVFFDPFDQNTAFAITQNHWTNDFGVINDLGAVYVNYAWKMGGSWQVLISNADIKAAIPAAYRLGGTDDNQFWIVGAAVTIGGQGYIYLLCYGSNELAFVVRTTDYGATLDCSLAMYSPYHSGHMWVGSDDPDYMAIVCTGSVIGIDMFIFTATWDNWPIDGTYGLWDWRAQLTMDERRQAAILIPYLNWNGAENDDTEIYLAIDGYGVLKSTDNGVTWAEWIPAAYINPPQTSTDQMLDAGSFSITAFDLTQRGMTLGDGGAKLYVFGSDNTTPSATHTLPMTVGWMGGWPALASQFYIGSPRNFGALQPYGTAVVQFSNDGCVTWNDWTRNLYDLAEFWISTTGHIGVVRIAPASED